MLLSLNEIKQTLKQCIPHASANEIGKAARVISKGQGAWKELDLNEDLVTVLNLQCSDLRPGQASRRGFRIRAFVTRKE